MKHTNIRQHFTTPQRRVMFALIFISAAVGASPSNHLKVEEGVKHYLLAQIGEQSDNAILDVSIMKIDERIDIPDCPDGFQFNASEEALGQAYITVRASCRNNDWYLFASGQVTRTKEIVVLQGAVSPGTVLTSSNLSLAKVDVKRLRHTAFSNIDSVVGARIKRRAINGQAVQANMLCFVCKGDRITITAESAGMKVKTSGIAQQDGVIGDSIKVINASSKKAIIARVASSEEVVINL